MCRCERFAAASTRFHDVPHLLLLTAQRRGELIELDFPAHRAEVCDEHEGLANALGCLPRWVGKSEFDYLVEIGSEEILRQLDPDFRALRALPVRGIIVTARSTLPEFDFVSRFFAPAAGIDEYPVTGSAHCALGPFWEAWLGRSDLLAFQASARGGWCAWACAATACCSVARP